MVTSQADFLTQAFLPHPVPPPPIWEDQGSIGKSILVENFTAKWQLPKSAGFVFFPAQVTPSIKDRLGQLGLRHLG